MPVPEEHSRAFTEIAHGSRMTSRMLTQVGDPTPGSSFATVNELYPFEKVSDRTRAYLSAAFEHLILWADYVAPLKFHPDQVTNFALRPHYTLARAALESAAQAAWVLATTDPIECVRRHLRLIRWDIDEHAKSKADLDEKRRIREGDAKLLERVATRIPEAEIRPPNGYLHVLREAVVADDSITLTQDEVERIWRAASGAAHGKYWPNIDLQSVVPGEEYEPGHFRALMFPDPAGIVEVMRAALHVTDVAALRFVDFSGADIPALIDEARLWLAERIPLRPDADPEIVARFSRRESAPDETES